MFQATLEDVVEALQRDSEHACFCHLESAEKRLDDALVDESAELGEGGAGCAVADRPHCFLLYFIVIQEEDLNEFVDDAHVKAHLDLVTRAGSDIRERPAHLFPHGLLLVVDELVEGLEGAGVNDELGLLIITRDDVADRPEAGH